MPGRTEPGPAPSRPRLRPEPDSHQVQELIAEGLDTAATVSLKGTDLGRTWNQHRAYRFNVTVALVAGSNELVVEFAAPVDTAERLSEESGGRPHINQYPFNAQLRS